MARKGNRKVSVEVYGLVNQALLGWYDGKEADVYEVTNDNQRTRFGFKGKAKIDKDWEAGFKLRSASARRTPSEPARSTPRATTTRTMSASISAIFTGT